MPDPTPKKKLPDDVRSLARAYTNLSVQSLAGIVQNGESEAARVSAAIHLLDRGWGKPKEDKNLTISGEVRVILRRMLDDEDEGE